MKNPSLIASIVGNISLFPSEAAEQTIECPHCKNETLLSIPPAETSQFVSCSCQHCNQPFEFDAIKLCGRKRFGAVSVLQPRNKTFHPRIKACRPTSTKRHGVNSQWGTNSSYQRITLSCSKFIASQRPSKLLKLVRAKVRHGSSGNAPPA